MGQLGRPEQEEQEGQAPGAQAEQSEQVPDGGSAAEEWRISGEVPEGFALDQPLSPFLLAALELLDRDDPDYALDVVSLVEATLEQPRQVLRAQEKEARSRAIAEMKADGVEYDERMERLEEITYPKPLWSVEKIVTQTETTTVQ